MRAHVSRGAEEHARTEQCSVAGQLGEVFWALLARPAHLAGLWAEGGDRA